MGLKLKKLAAALFLAFVALFLVRFALGFFVDFERRMAARAAQTFRGRYSSVADVPYSKDVSTNVVRLISQGQWTDWTDKRSFAAISGEAIQLLQVFAKEARVESTTKHFEQDEQKARKAVEAHGAAVRIEETGGIKPHRSLCLVIRVPEDKFDALVGELDGIGELWSIGISKQDRTDEAKRLYAEGKALEAYRDSLVKLRQREGTVDELAQLEEKIQGVEQELQSLGVRMGDLVKAESHDNVSFSLTEWIPFFVDEDRYPLAARVADALVWTIKWYVLSVVLLALVYAACRSVRILAGGSGAPPMTRDP